MKYLPFYVLLFASLPVFGCDDDGFWSFPLVDSQSGFHFPAAIGNQWVYLDSIDGTVRTGNTVIVGSKDSAGLKWWYLDNRGYASADLGAKFAIRHDSLFTLVGCWLGTNIEVTLCFPRDTTFEFDRPMCDYPLGGAVTRGTGLCRTPAGDFLDWGTIVFDYGFYTDSLVVVSRVGIVSRTVVGYVFGTEGKRYFRYNSRLVRYDVSDIH